MIALALLSALLSASDAAPPQTCKPDKELSYICGMERPEDIIQIPGTNWLIASGYAAGSGLKLVDTGRRIARSWYPPSRRADFAPTYPDCSEAPSASVFNAHGISLRRIAPRRYRLYVVNHGGRESIEVFEFSVGTAAAVPTLEWHGCLPLPAGLVGNAVASFGDGPVLTTVLTRPGTTIANFMHGRPTGGVYQWRPGDKSFGLLPGTELPGNNGLETSPDQRHFYVVAFGWHSVVEFDRWRSSKPTRRFVAPDFMPDNVRWFQNGLIAAGMRLYEPACGGYRKIVNGVADPMLCHRGYTVAKIDLTRGTMHAIATGGPEAQFNGVSSAAIVGNTLWLGSYQSDRLAYRTINRDN
jgi:hypothetical protein